MSSSRKRTTTRNPVLVRPPRPLEDPDLLELPFSLEGEHCVVLVRRRYGYGQAIGWWVNVDGYPPADAQALRRAAEAYLDHFEGHATVERMLTE